MSFHDQFMAHFTTEEQASDIVQIWNDIGVVAEKAIVEELNAQLNETLDISSFSVDRLRSWLAFYLMQVRNVKATTTLLTVTCLQAADLVVIPAGSVLLDKEGKKFYIDTPITLNQDSTEKITAYQGVMSSLTGTYNDIIDLEVDAIDLDSITLTLNGDAVSKCALMRSGVVGEINYDVSYIIPRNGFYATYYDGHLYIKVFKGDLVGDPEGATFVLTYRTSDGYSGKTGANSITSFQDQILDINGDPVTLQVTNTESHNGLDAPTRWELQCLLRANAIAGVSISTVPEYEAWFLAQDGIGDCKILSDFIRTGQTEQVSTGGIVVYLCHLDGSRVTEAEFAALQARLEDKKDMCTVSRGDFEPVYHQIDIRYSACSDDVSFQNEVRELIKNLYTVTGARDNRTSLFESLDLSKLNLLIGDRYNVSGLSISGNFKQLDGFAGLNKNPDSKAMTLGDYSDFSIPGVTYEIYNPVDPTQEVPEAYVRTNKFQEMFTIDAQGAQHINIYWQKPDSNGAGYTLVFVGYRNLRVAEFEFADNGVYEDPLFGNIYPTSYIVAYLPPKNPIALNVGTNNGLRRLIPSEPEESALWRKLFGDDSNNGISFTTTGAIDVIQ